jgi:hypothetical protein
MPIPDVEIPGNSTKVAFGSVQMTYVKIICFSDYFLN